jgi:hypothetical protein
LFGSGLTFVGGGAGLLAGGGCGALFAESTVIDNACEAPALRIQRNL